MRDEGKVCVAPLSPVRRSSPVWEALPVSSRVSERLGDVLVLATELRAELEHQDAAPLAWILPVVEGVIASTDTALKRLSS